MERVALPKGGANSKQGGLTGKAVFRFYMHEFWCCGQLRCRPPTIARPPPALAQLGMLRSRLLSPAAVEEVLAALRVKQAGDVLVASLPSGRYASLAPNLAALCNLR